MNVQHRIKHNELSDENIAKKTVKKLFGGSSNDERNDNTNKIYFWEDVDIDTCKKLIENIQTVENNLLDVSKNYNIPFESLPAIEIYINSSGGSIHDAFAVIDYIKSSKFKFTSIIQGHAASAATIISTVCDNRKIYESGYVLIHQISSGVVGKITEMTDEINTCKKIMDKLIQIYRGKTLM